MKCPSLCHVVFASLSHRNLEKGKLMASGKVWSSVLGGCVDMDPKEEKRVYSRQV